MILHSLRWRLLLGAGLAILASLVLAWLFMTLLFGRHAERQMEAILTQDGLRLAAAAGLPPAEPGFDAALEDPRFITPASGLYWQVTPAQGPAYRSRSLWDQELAADERPPSDRWRTRLAPGPFGSRVLIVERRMETGIGPIEVRVAQNAVELDLARRAFGWDLAAFLTLLWLILAVAAWLQVETGLRPLAGIKADIDRLRRNPAERLPAARLAEVAPLIDAINGLADARADDMQRARRRAADMAHGLKTPTAALAAQVRRLPPGDAVEGLRRSIAAIRETVEAELTRSRIAITRTEAGLSVRAAPVVRQLAAVLSHTERGAQIALDIDLPEDFAVPMDAADLTEMLGPVLDNAVRHASGRVRVRGEGGSSVRLIVEDDGEGIPAAGRDLALNHGLRLDERPGAGLGLAIAKGIAEATHGAISLSESPLGGLKVELSWKASAA